MNDTPETDKIIRNCSGDAVEIIGESLSRLERERNEWAALAGQYKAERDEAIARVEIIAPSKNNPVAEFFSSRNTPETDSAKWIEVGFNSYVVSASVSKKLERERDEAREERDAALLVIKGLKE